MSRYDLGKEVLSCVYVCVKKKRNEVKRGKSMFYVVLTWNVTQHDSDEEIVKTEGNIETVGQGERQSISDTDVGQASEHAQQFTLKEHNIFWINFNECSTGP